MDIDKLVAAVERFFLDIVGLVVPGALLLVGLHVVFGRLELGSLTFDIPLTSTGWTFFVVLAYVLGHAITFLGEEVLGRVSPWLVGKLPEKYRGPIISESETMAQIARRVAAREFVQRYHAGISNLGRGQELEGPKVREYRSLAMTVSKAEDRATTIRFMFLSLLNLGIATVLWILGVVFGVCILLKSGVFPVVRGEAGVGTLFMGLLEGIGMFLGAIVFSIPFLHRRFYFYRTTMHLPFSTGAAVLRQEQEGSKKAVDGTVVPVAGSGRPVVYLAGGLHTGWQDEVIRTFPEFEFLNPRDHGLPDPAAYTAWDLAAIRKCDLVFAYLEKTNPAGYALSVEVGYAAALGKPVILVDARSAGDEVTGRYLSMVREVATYSTDSFDDGLASLKARGLLMRASR